MENKIIIGIDLSTNHCGIVNLDYASGKVFETSILTDLKMFLDTKFVNYKHYFESRYTEEERNNFVARRRKFVSTNIYKCVLRMLCDWNDVVTMQTPFNNVYVAIEDYAYGLHSRGILEGAEIIGILKNSLYCQGINLRLVDPSSLKKWATSRGHCLKKKMVEAARSEGFNIPDKLIKVVNKKIKKMDTEEYDGPGTDLADAYFLAQMLRVELLVREGNIEIRDLPVNRRDVFLRASDMFPDNLIVRPFICKGEEE